MKSPFVIMALLRRRQAGADRREGSLSLPEGRTCPCLRMSFRVASRPVRISRNTPPHDPVERPPFAMPSAPAAIQQGLTFCVAETRVVDLSFFGSGLALGSRPGSPVRLQTSRREKCRGSRLAGQAVSGPPQDLCRRARRRAGGANVAMSRPYSRTRRSSSFFFLTSLSDM